MIRDYQIASLVVSNCCLIAAAVVFDRLLRLDYKETTRRRALMFLMFNPVSFFFSCAYTELLTLPPHSLPRVRDRRDSSALPRDSASSASGLLELCGRFGPLRSFVVHARGDTQIPERVFPFYVVLASLAERAKWTYEPLLALSSALLALCTVAFANAYQMT